MSQYFDTARSKQEVEEDEKSERGWDRDSPEFTGEFVSEITKGISLFSSFPGPLFKLEFRLNGSNKLSKLR